MPPKNGGVRKANWTGFWESYQVAVHDNTLLSPIDKFNYLNSLLEGAAARAIQGLSLTSANYEHAIALLKERFGKPQRVITSHMDELLKIPSCNKDNPSSLRYVYDKISIHVRGLESLGVSADQYGSLLIPIIMDKLPSEIKLQVARKATGEVWEINELLKTIQVEVEAREASDASKVHNASSSSSKTQRLQVRQMLCSVMMVKYGVFIVRGSTTPHLAKLLLTRKTERML
jgi:hypothetical protein